MESGEEEEFILLPDSIFCDRFLAVAADWANCRSDLPSDQGRQRVIKSVP